MERTYPLALVLTTVALLLGGCQPERIAAPASFVPYTAPDRSFICQAPAGWQSQSAAAHAVMSGALFKSGEAKIDITSDLAGSLMGDIARSANTMAESAAESLAAVAPGLALPKTRPPVETLHMAGKKALAGKLDGYEETPGQPFPSPLGEARFSEYQAGGGLLKERVRGYRVTILGGERLVTVVCQCPEGDWPALAPAFQQVIGSLAPGSG